MRYRFTLGDRLAFEGRTFIYCGTAPGGHILRLENDQLDQFFSDEQIAAATTTINWSYQRGFSAPAIAAARARADVNTLAEIENANERLKTLWKYEVICAVEDHHSPGKINMSDDSLKSVLETISPSIQKLECSRIIAKGKVAKAPGKGRAGQFEAYRKLPSPKTFRRWYKIFLECGRAPYALRDAYRRSGNRTRRLEPEIYELIARHAKSYCSSKQPTFRVCYEGLKRELKQLNATREASGLNKFPRPSRRALRRQIERVPAFRRYATRHGLEEARRHFALVTSAPEALMPGQRVEMDAWRVSLSKLLITSDLYRRLPESERKEHRARWVLCVAVDAATDVILGMVLAPNESANVALRTLQMVLRDKNEIGYSANAKSAWNMAVLPEMITTDTGPAFISAAYQTAASSVCTDVNFGPVGRPNMRGKIERLFGTIDSTLLTAFTGRTFANVVVKGDYDPGANASITVEDFATALTRYVVDLYLNGAHLDEGSESPRNAWTRLSKHYGLTPLPGRNEMRAIFGIEIECKTSTRGICFMNLHYMCEVVGKRILAKGFGKVTVKVDFEDIGAVSAYIDGKWHAVPCVDIDLNGTDLNTWREAAADLRRRYAKDKELTEDIVRDAIEAIQKLAKDSEKRVGLTKLAPTAEELAAAENEILAGPLMIDRRARLGGQETFEDPFGPGMPTGPRSTPSQSTEPTDGDGPPSRPVRRWT